MSASQRSDTQPAVGWRWKRWLWLLLITGVPAGVPAIVWFYQPDPGDPALRAFVHARPPVPIVFTSRSEPASFVAAAPGGEVYTEPGQPLWQAREGRLRLLM